MTSPILALTLASGLAHAHTPDTEGPPAPVDALALVEGPLPTEVALTADGWTADGHPVTGTDAEQEMALIAVLSRADGNAARVDRAYKRNIGALAVASGGLGIEVAGLVVAIGVATGGIGMAAGPALAIGLGAGGAGIGLTACGVGIANRPLKRAVKQYNAWAEAHPDALATLR